MKQATINDVAALARVSKTTVSHVINGTRFVEEETRLRVLNAIAELGYRPSVAARSLTTKRTGTIGIVVSDISNPFFGELLLGVEEILRPRNYALIICNTNETLEYEAHYLDLLLNQRVEGIIAAATSQPWIELSRAKVQHVPVVFMDRAFDNIDDCFVGVNNRAGAYQGTRHLTGCGYTKIGILSGLARLSTMRERLEGFTQAVRDAGLPVREEWIVPSLLSVEGGRQAMRQLLSVPERPEAVFINNNLLALGALLELRDAGLQCPDDLGIVCFDDHPWAAVSCPPLTVVQQPTRQLGHVSAEMILKLINNEPIPEKQIFLDCELIIRQSCRSVAGKPTDLERGISR